MVAHIVDFAPETIAEQSTYKPGENGLPPVGLPHVIVNGVFVKRDGEATRALPGLPIRYPVEPSKQISAQIPFDSGRNGT
jgi:hypothetical protein